MLAKVASLSKTPIATGENLFSMPDCKNCIRYGGLDKERDYLQFDPALSYGLVEYLQTLEMLNMSGWSSKRCLPHGGHLMNFHLAAGLGLGGAEAYPYVFQPFGELGDNVNPEKGKIRLPEIPGIGYENNSKLMDIFLEAMK